MVITRAPAAAAGPAGLDFEQATSAAIPSM